MKIFLSRLCMNLDSVFGRTNWIIPPHHESGRHYGSTLMLILGPQKYFKLTTHNRYLYTDVQATPFQQSFLCSFAAGPTLVPVPSLTAGPTKPPPQGPTQGKPPQLGPTAGNSSMYYNYSLLIIFTDVFAARDVYCLYPFALDLYS